MFSSLSLFAIYRVPDQVFLHGSKYMKHTFIGAHFFWQINIFVFTFVHESISTLDIKFFTLSLELLQNMPVVLLTALISNIYFASQLFYNNEPNNIFAKVLGVWEEGENGQTVPTSGLCYYLSPPTSFVHFFYDPFHFVFYLLFVCTACAIFSKAWTEVNHTTSRDVARQLAQQQISIRGMREQATANLLKKYIPISAALGGMSIGLLTVVADFIGAIGSGTGILMAVTIIYDYYEAYAKAQMAGMGVDMAKLGFQ